MKSCLFSGMESMEATWFYVLEYFIKMVKLTIDLIARGTSGYTKKKRDESMSQYLRRLTHLYLEDRNIDEVVCHLLWIVVLSFNLSSNWFIEWYKL